MPSPSGPSIAWLYHRLLALLCLVAWLSLAAQVQVLIGSRGLLPIAQTVTQLEAAGVTPLEAPMLFWWVHSDAALTWGVVLGILLSVLALGAVWPRLCFVAMIPLYLSYAVGCRDFLSFQWDNLLIESLFLGALLPTDRPAPWRHLTMRLLLFKLYFESGIAKWQSHLGDWIDGSAMTFYYETAPIPTRLALYAHHLPDAWHHFESWFTLLFEIVLPFAIFGPRKVRFVCLVVLSGFQIVNMATANYGFFAWAALCLHVFVLSEDDLSRSLRRKPTGEARPVLGIPLFVFYAATSLWMGLVRFADVPGHETLARIGAFRIVNNYHLFGHITRERIEPELQVLHEAQWLPRHFRYKPGPVDRPPPFVAPHQPRVDFRLWFYGLSFRRSTPDYVMTLVSRVCHDPEAVQGLFSVPLVADPDAVRLVYWRYRFVRMEDHRETGDWWTRELVHTTQTLPCERIAR